MNCNTCNNFDGFGGDGRALFIRGDLRAREGLRQISCGAHDIERGIVDMQRGMVIAQRELRRNNDGCRAFREQFCRCFCRHGHGGGCDCGDGDGWNDDFPVTWI